MNEKRRVAFHTLGCKVNQADTDALAGAFASRGFSIVEFDETADVYIVNTCTVTNLADRKSRQMLRRAVRNNPSALVVATGCFAQVEGETLAKEIPGIDIVTGTRGRTGLVDLVEERLEKGTGLETAAVKPHSEEDEFEEFDVPSITGRTRASLKIEEGCQEFCSYCKIPYARGPVRSRDFSRIIKEVQELSQKGFKEIVLTGIHLGHYGKETDYQRTISDVVRAVAEVEGIRRVRLSSIDPTDVSDELIELAATNPVVCRHFHIPLQGGHNDILKAMNRKYDLEYYTGLVERIRTAIPEVAISTDIIVGFPGETDEHFNSTMDFTKRMAFSRLHVFKYSIRSGTPAASMPNQVQSKVKELRSESLIELGHQLSESYHKRFLGKIQDVLVESVDDKNCLEGLTDTYIRVQASFQEQLDRFTEDIYPVRIINATSDGVFGEVMEDFGNGR